MKMFFKSILAVWVVCLVAATCVAQNGNARTARWASDKGYWVVESNINDPLNHVVRFYTNDDALIYKETLTGIKLNPDKRKVKMKLKKVLESSVVAWEKRRVSEEDKQYVAAILK